MARNVKIVQIDRRDNSLIKRFNSITEASQITGIPNGTIGTIVIKKGATRNPNFTFLYERDYKNIVKNDGKIKEKKEIIRKKEKEYYVNVLVGLANGTLEDGALYRINNSDLIYNKELNRLEINNMSILTQQEMWKEIDIELPLLTSEERQFIKSLLKAFGDSEVKGIIKCNGLNLGYEFLRIDTTRTVDIVDLPEYLEGKYYKSLEQNRLYSLDELGLK